jgi:hypothetical protein
VKEGIADNVKAGDLETLSILRSFASTEMKKVKW